jgi:hypothetical protein
MVETSPGEEGVPFGLDIGERGDCSVIEYDNNWYENRNSLEEVIIFLNIVNRRC